MPVVAAPRESVGEEVGADVVKQAERLSDELSSRRGGDRRGLASLEVDLGRLRESMEPGSYGQGTVDGLLAAIRAVAGSQAPSGLGPQTALFEPGSIPEQLLVEIARGVRGANADLAETLETDQWQISRAGRRLRELGLAERTRTGRINQWTLTRAGEGEARRLSGRSVPSPRR